MSRFATALADRVEGYIALRRSLGYAFQKQASILRALTQYGLSGACRTRTERTRPDGRRPIGLGGSNHGEVSNAAEAGLRRLDRHE